MANFFDRKKLTKSITLIISFNLKITFLAINNINNIFYLKIYFYKTNTPILIAKKIHPLKLTVEKNLGT